MIKQFFNKLFGRNTSKSQQSSLLKTFRQKKKSVFLNRYAGVFYFLITWHCFGYIVASVAKKKANEQG